VLGAYVLADPVNSTHQALSTIPDVVLMSSGSEVAFILAAHERLAAEGIASRVVSMPSHELFARQSEEYRASVLPPDVPRVAIEAAHPMSWYKWVGDNGVVLGLERFGASAPYERIYEELGLTVDKVVDAAMQLVGSRR
jgi:transketolase